MATPASGSSAYGSSLGVSLALHGAIVVTLALTFQPWAAPNDARRGLNMVAHLEEVEPQPTPEPAEALEAIAEPADDTDIPIEEFDVPQDTVPEWSPAEPTPSVTPGTSLLETVVYPRVRPRTASELPVPVVPAEAPIEPPADAEPQSQPQSQPQSNQKDSSPEPVVGACPPPGYPRLAERRGWTGTVVLLIDVAADGSVTGVRVESSSGHSVLDDAAVRAVKEWLFAPALADGSPTAATVRKPIRFGAH